MADNTNFPGSSEIEAALEEFNKQEEEYNAKKAVREEHKVSGMAAFLMRHSGGIIQNEREAEYFLLVISIAAILFSIFFYINGREGGEYAPLRLPTPYEEGRL